MGDSPRGRPGTSSRPGTSGTAGRVRGRSDQLMTVASRLKTAMYISDRALPPEDVTVASIEHQLRIPTLASGLTEESLVMTSCGQDGLVTDPDFMPGLSALYPDPNQPPASALEGLTWRRVSGTLYFPRGKTARLLQGVLEDGWFLGALGAVAACRGSELLLDLIVSDDCSGQGAYTFQFYKHGCWQQVVVDNYLPCLADQERLAFACSAVVGELWPSLLEKAYAKVHGSFYSLARGSVAEALVDLTGGVGFKLRMDAPAARAALADGTLWRDLAAWLGAGSIVACRAKRRAAARSRWLRPDAPADGAEPSEDADAAHLAALLAAEEERQAAEDEDAAAAAARGASGDGSGALAGGVGHGGLLYEQVYSVLEARSVGGGVTLLRVHCPWPDGIWMGPWSTGSDEWGLPLVSQQLDYFRASWEDEATFWIPLQDFLAHFNRLYVCRLFPPHWHQLTLHCGWQGPSAGGPYYVPLKGGHTTNGGAPAVDDPAAAAGLHDPFAEVQRPTEDGGDGSSALAAAAAVGSEAASASGRGGLGRSASNASNGAGGAAAAAVAAGAAGGSTLSSTWCCNPQFRLTMRHPRGAEVVVCVSQQDPRVASRGHVAKRHRKRAIGMQVLRVPLDRLGRAWDVRPGEVVASLPASAGREISTSFRAQPDSAYIVVPHAGRAGDEGAFVLRTFSSQPLELEQLPAPLCLVVGGLWAGYLAGGGRGCAGWGSNPQYMISAPQRTVLVAALARTDIKYSLIKPAPDPYQQLGLVLATPEPAPEGPGRRAAVREGPGGGIVAEAPQGGPLGNEEVVLQVILEPEQPYLLVPSIVQPGTEAPFELRLMSGAPLELVPLPEAQVVQLTGEWGSDSAGGCDVHPLWKRNPKFHICMASYGRVRVALARAGRARARHPVDDMIGFYLLRASSADGEIRGDMRRAVVAESTFVPQPETAAEYELNGGCHYVIMPCTYSPNRTGRFTLSVLSAVGFTLRSLQAGEGEGAGGPAGTGHHHHHQASSHLRP